MKSYILVPLSVFISLGKRKMFLFGLISRMLKPSKFYFIEFFEAMKMVESFNNEKGESEAQFVLYSAFIVCVY